MITSRLNKSEALQYRHLMLKALLYQKRGVRCVSFVVGSVPAQRRLPLARFFRAHSRTIYCDAQRQCR